MRQLGSPLIFFILCLVFSRPVHAGVDNVIRNAGFEIPIGGGSNWDNTANRGISIVTGAAPEDSRFLRLDEATTVGGGFAGVFTFQTAIVPAKPGDFVSLSGLVRANSLDVGDEGQIRIEFQTTGGTIISGVNASVSAVSAAFARLSVSGVAPAGTEQAVFVLRIQPSNAGGGSQVDYDAMEGTISSTPIVLQPASGGTTRNMHPGQLTMVGLKVLNVSADTITNTEVVVSPSAGLNVIPEKGFLNGRFVSEREGSVIYNLGNMTRAQDAFFDFPILVSSGALPGKRYEITITARSNGQTLSNALHVVILIEPDPLFDEGTVLGKVFDDRDEDGAQSKGEIGVPGVRLYTEYGVSVVTDADGRFHIPAVSPGRHVLKIDGHTLPPGTNFVTEESLLIKTTPGLLNKVRFAVRLPESALPEEIRKGLHVWVTQGVDMTRPELRVLMDADTLRIGLGRVEREPAFHLKTNYADYIFGWRLEVFNEMGEKIWSGVGIAKPPADVPWNGMTDLGELIRPGVYAYRLVVRDSLDHEDWTPLHFFRVVSKADPDSEKKPFEVPEVGSFNIFRDGRQSIPLVAKPTLRIYGKTEPGRRVELAGLPVDVDPDGEFHREFFVQPGDKTIAVSATNAQGDTITEEQKITVKNSSFFLVALGEEEMGVNFNRGNQETVAREDSFHEDFYEDGKVAYYLKAKIKGKFLVKSRYDTGAERSQFFTQLDPDDYYPVYGDSSQISYEGQETKQRLYLLIEMDRSHLQWGSFQTHFLDTELARYNRTLSGLKIHHETLSSTKYGDAKRAITLFATKADTRADHVEFRATGGSLYYLRNRNIVSGSEKIRIEIRDKIQDMPLESRDLMNGQDYEIDYRQGRILLRKPLSSVAASETIISNDILDGNPVFLVVDYEFQDFEIFKDSPAGVRGYTHLGDHIRIGGTAVEEKRMGEDYDLRSVDATIKTGRNTKVTMEYAEAKLQQELQALSYDGGLSFQNQNPIGGRRPREGAYLIKAESKPVEQVELSGYLQKVNPGFSVDRIKSQEGYQKFGLQSKFKVSPHFYILARHDATRNVTPLGRVIEGGYSAPFNELLSTTGQAVFDYARWKVTGEFLHQSIDLPSINHRTPSLFSERPTRNAVGAKVARQVSDWLAPYARTQLTMSGKNNFQAGGGVEVKAGDRATMYFEEMLGSIGDETLLGISAQRDQKTTNYANIKMRDTGFGDRQVATTLGSSHRLNEHSRVYSEREHSTYTGNLPTDLLPVFAGDTPPLGVWNSDIYGYDTRLGEKWDLGLKFERRHLEASDFRNISDAAESNFAQPNTYNTVAMSWGYTDPKKFKFSDSVELRGSQSAPKIEQWVTQNSAEWKVNQDLSFLGRMNFGTSRFIEPGNTAGQFTELGTGLAYRPVESDRLTWLTKYTFLNEMANDAQFVRTHSGSLAVDEQSHIFSVEGGYELTKNLQGVEKLAYRMARVEGPENQPVRVGTLLWVNRLNYHIIRKWDLGLEYRMLFQFNAAESMKHGPLLEIDREVYDYVRLGIGYNFTDFDDELRRVNDFRRNGFFVRLSGKV